MGNSVSYEDTGFLLRKSKNTIVGYSTQEKGRIYVPKDGGVPYPEGMINVLKYRMKTEGKKTNSPNLDRKKAAEEEIKEIKEHYMVIIGGTSCEDFIEYIDSIRKSSGIRETTEKGLSKKVLDTEEIPEPLQEPIIEKESETTVYQPKAEYEEAESKPKKKTTEELVKNPHLTDRELSMPLDNLVDLTLRKIYEVKKRIKKNPTSERQEELKNLEMKYRSIYSPWKTGVFK